jgi:O-acetyl-ADP-ribose deacetylase (regulator of RNase III)
LRYNLRNAKKQANEDLMPCLFAQNAEGGHHGSESVGMPRRSIADVRLSMGLSASRWRANQDEHASRRSLAAEKETSVATSPLRSLSPDLEERLRRFLDEHEEKAEEEEGKAVAGGSIGLDAVAARVDVVAAQMATQTAAVRRQLEEVTRRLEDLQAAHDDGRLQPPQRSSSMLRGLISPRRTRGPAIN